MICGQQMDQKVRDELPKNVPPWGHQVLVLRATHNKSCHLKSESDPQRVEVFHFTNMHGLRLLLLLLLRWLLPLRRQNTTRNIVVNTL